MRRILLISICLIQLSTTCFSQTTLYPNDLPASGDGLNIHRPRLTFKGFTSKQSTGALDVKTFVNEILLNTSVTVEDNRLKELFKITNDPSLFNIVFVETVSKDNPKRAGNARYLEAVALSTLLCLILEKNHGAISATMQTRLAQMDLNRDNLQTLRDDHIRLRTQLVQAFQASLTVTGGGYFDDLTQEWVSNQYKFKWRNFVEEYPVTDKFKEARSLMTFARAWDFYLALEKTNNNISEEAFT
jgi:hypothetical protein